jgi:hypothetical protein
MHYRIIEESGKQPNLLLVTTGPEGAMVIYPCTSPDCEQIAAMKQAYHAQWKGRKYAQRLEVLETLNA